MASMAPLGFQCGSTAVMLSVGFVVAHSSYERALRAEATIS